MSRVTESLSLAVFLSDPMLRLFRNNPWLVRFFPRINKAFNQATRGIVALLVEQQRLLHHLLVELMKKGAFPTHSYTQLHIPSNGSFRSKRGWMEKDGCITKDIIHTIVREADGTIKGIYINEKSDPNVHKGIVFLCSTITVEAFTRLTRDTAVPLYVKPSGPKGKKGYFFSGMVFPFFCEWLPPMEYVTGTSRRQVLIKLQYVQS